jgi:hypothetical protein
MPKIIVTNHAEKRAKRVLPNKKAAMEIAQEAFDEGIRHEETAGRLRRYIDWLYFREKTANNIRIYHQKVFLFHGDVLITIFDLPQSLNTSVEAIKKKRKLDKYNEKNKRIK